jgi:glycosyltransferase 2 family protein
MRLKLLLKIGISAALIVYILLVQVKDPGLILQTLRAMRPGPLLIAFCLHFTGLYLSGLRWQILLSVQGISCRVWPLILSYLVGGFFNLFLPTQVGGDVIRGLDTRARGKSVARPFGVIVVERITGMFTLLVLALLSLACGFTFPQENHVTLGVTLLLALMLGGAALLFWPPFLRLLRRLRMLRRLGKSGSLLSEFHQSLTLYAAHPRPFAWALFVGLLLQINYIFHFYFVGEALGLHLGAGFYFVSVPVMCVLLLLPVTFSGVGLREGGNVAFFRLMGRSASEGVAFSLTGFAMTVVFGIIGGIVYALRSTTPAGESQAGELNSA